MDWEIKWMATFGHEVKEVEICLVQESYKLYIGGKYYGDFVYYNINKEAILTWPWQNNYQLQQ